MYVWMKESYVEWGGERESVKEKGGREGKLRRERERERERELQKEGDREGGREKEGREGVTKGGR